jgi:hypothetical protein
MPKPQLALDVIPSSLDKAAITAADRITRSDQAVRWQRTFGTPMPQRLHRALAADCLIYEEQVQAARGKPHGASNPARVCCGLGRAAPTR